MPLTAGHSQNGSSHCPQKFPTASVLWPWLLKSPSGDRSHSASARNAPPPQCWHRGPTAVLAVSSHSVRTCFCISVLPSSRDGEHCCVVLALARKSIDSFPTRQSVTLVRRVQIFHSSYPSHYLSFQPGILSVSAVPFFASELRSSPPRHTSSLPRVSRLTVSTCRTLHQYAQMAQEIPNRSLKMHRKPT